MCQYKNDKVKIANTDIICYKQIFISSTGELVSPLYPFKWILNQIYTEPIMFENEFNHVVVTRGFHAFKTLSDVKFDLFPDTEIFKAIIPKGSVYIEGYNLYEKETVVSNTMKIVEKIK